RDTKSTQPQAATSRPADASSSAAVSSVPASDAVDDEPTTAPSVAPAASGPNRRLPCSLSKTSTISAQNSETTNRLNTDVQTKKTRPIHGSCSDGSQRNAAAKATRFAAKNRYASGTKRSRGMRRTSAEKAGFNASMAASVAVN